MFFYKVSLTKDTQIYYWFTKFSLEVQIYDIMGWKTEYFKIGMKWKVASKITITNKKWFINPQSEPNTNLRFFLVLFTENLVMHIMVGCYKDDRV